MPDAMQQQAIPMMRSSPGPPAEAIKNIGKRHGATGTARPARRGSLTPIAQNLFKPIVTSTSTTKPMRKCSVPPLFSEEAVTDSESNDSDDAEPPRRPSPKMANIPQRHSPPLLVAMPSSPEGSLPAVSPQRPATVKPSKHRSSSLQASSTVEAARQAALAAFAEAGGVTKTEEPSTLPKIASSPQAPIPDSHHRRKRVFTFPNGNQALHGSASVDSCCVIKPLSVKLKGVLIPNKYKFTAMKRGWVVEGNIPHTIHEGIEVY